MFTMIGLIIGIISVIILSILYKRTHDDTIIIIIFLILSETLLRLLPINTRIFVPVEILLVCYLLYQVVKNERVDLFVLLVCGVTLYITLLLNGFVFHNEMSVLFVMYYAYVAFTSPSINPFEC